MPLPAWVIPLLISGLQVGASYLEKKPEAEKIDRFTPEQEELQNKILKMFEGQFGQGIQGRPSFQAGESYLTNLLSGNPESFQNFEEPFKRQYFEETVPALAERFSSLGAQRSSGFQNALAKSGSDLSQNLAAMRSGLQMQALPSALGFAGAPGEQALNALRFGMEPAYNSYYSGRQGPFTEALTPITSAFGRAYGERIAGGF